MSLQALRCPTCGAPVKGVASLPAPCSYCGTLLVNTALVNTALVGNAPVDAKAGEGPTEERFSLKLRVGPSNRLRVIELLRARLGAKAPAVNAFLNDASVELELGRDEEKARQLAHDVSEAGAQAEVIARTVPIPMAGVTLDAVGGRRLAVIVALRSHVVELTLDDAKRLVEDAPSVVVASIELPRAQALVDALLIAGARARLC